MNKAAYILILLCLAAGYAHAQKNRYAVRKYSELAAMNVPLPYIKYYGADSSLLVYGSNHTQDHNNVQIADIERRILAYRPDVILYEGDGIAVESTKEKTVNSYFEMGLVKYLADSLKIKAMNIEPPTAGKYKYLLKRYSIDEVLLATLGLQLTMMQMNRDDLEKSYPFMIASLIKEGLPLSEKQQTIQYFYKIYKQYFKTDFSYDSFDSRNVQAKYDHTVLNRVNRAANEYRDQYIISLVDALLKENKKVYLQIGGWHAIVCEPAFSTMKKINNNAKGK